jgi:hypothetical protein
VPDRSMLPDDFLVSRDVRSGVVHFTSRRDGSESYRLEYEPGWLFLKERDGFVAREHVERAVLGQREAYERGGRNAMELGVG